MLEASDRFGHDTCTRMDISNEQQNIAQLQTPTMGVTINKKSKTTEPPP